MPHGPSSTTMSDIENGDFNALAAKTFRKLDQSLEWEPGSARRTYEGGDPAPIENRVVLDLQAVPTDHLLNEIRRRLNSVSSADHTQVWPPPHLRVDDPDEIVQNGVSRPRRSQLPG